MTDIRVFAHLVHYSPNGYFLNCVKSARFFNKVKFVHANYYMYNKEMCLFNGPWELYIG